MSEGRIPEAVRRCLVVHIRSLEQLEVLILLRAAADREWSASAVSREQGSSVASIQARLSDLTARGFLVAREAEGHVSYRFAPTTEETRHLVDELARVYKERRLRVVNLLYATPESEIAPLADAVESGSDKEKP